jgi:hypothetical protein
VPLSNYESSALPLSYSGVANGFLRLAVPLLRQAKMEARDLLSSKQTELKSHNHKLARLSHFEYF